MLLFGAQSRTIQAPDATNAWSPDRHQKLRTTLLSVSLALFASTLATAEPIRACEEKPRPPGATELNYTKIAFDICPTRSDIAVSGRGISNKLYNGVWWNKTLTDDSLYVDNPDGSLSIAQGGVLATVPTNMVAGNLPLLAGDRGFFVEFEVSLSDNDQDHFPAVWLLPIEHNSVHDDSYQPEPRSFERWLEIDVDEGGFAAGPMGTAISWSGIWPNYQRVRSNPDLKNAKIDRTQRHRFGAGFDPQNLKITFWYDDKLQYVASGESVPEVARKQHFFVIMNAANHKLRLPYTMNVYRVRAFVPN